VAFARNFLDAVDRSAEPAGAVENAPAPAAQAAAAPMAEAPVRAGVAAHSVVWLLTAAAAVLVAVFGTLRFRAGDHARPSSPVAEARVPATGRMSAGNGASADSRQAAPWPAASSQPLDAAAPKRDARIVALELFPQTRAVATIPALAIPAGARDLELRLRLESSDFRRYQAGLHDPATNEVVWRSAWTAAGPDRDRPYVRIVIPAGMLKPQHYSLDLAGRGEAGEPEIVGSYAFEVLPP
jgi:hypothetical protein